MVQQILDWLTAEGPALGALAALIGILAGLIGALRVMRAHVHVPGHAKEQPTARPATVSELDWATQKLAETMKAQWEAEASRLGLLAKSGAGGLPAMLATSLIRIGWSVDTATLPIPPEGQTNDKFRAWANHPRVDQLADFFHDVQPPALVVLGSAESGKSATAVLLTLGLLSKRATDTDPVPVKFSLDHWDHGLSLGDWLRQRLLEDQPGLRSTDTYGPDVVSALLRERRILPILDGLDELPGEDERPGASERDRVIESINESTLLLPGLVMTCQAAKYDELNNRLREAVIVKLEGVSPVEAARYIENAAREHKDPERWQPILDYLMGTDDGPLMTAMSSPLMIYLAAKVYGNPKSSPSDLLGFEDQGADAIREHLLQAFIPAVFPKTVGRSDPRRWRSDDAARWLGHIAAHLDQVGSDADPAATQFGWWELSTHGRPGTAVMAGVIGGSVGGSAVGLAFTALFNGTAGLIAGAATGVVLGILSWRNEPPKPSETQRRATGRATSILKSGLAIGVIVFVGGLVARDVYLGILAGIGFGLPLSVLYGLTEPDPTIRPLDAGLLLRRDIRVGVTFGLTYGVPAGITGWFLSGDPVLSTWVGIMAGLAGALLYGPIWIFAAFAPGGGLGKLRAVGVVAFVHLMIATLWFAPRKRLPWNVVGFLDEAHDLGVLRLVSGSYEFRHGALQKVLAAESLAAGQSGVGRTSRTPTTPGPTKPS